MCRTCAVTTPAWTAEVERPAMKRPNTVPKDVFILDAVFVVVAAAVVVVIAAVVRSSSSCM